LLGKGASISVAANREKLLEYYASLQCGGGHALMSLPRRGRSVHHHHVTIAALSRRNDPFIVSKAIGE